MRSRFYLAFLSLLLFATASSIALETHSWNTRNIQAMREFQASVGGIGIGAISAPYWCFIVYDPRIESACTCLEWPVPGGYCYCPEHTGTVSYIKETPFEEPMQRIREHEKTPHPPLGSQ